MRISSHQGLALPLSVTAAFALTLGACDEQQPSAPEIAASHGPGVVTENVTLFAVDSRAAARNGFNEGDPVGSITVVDDQAGHILTVTGSAEGLDPAAGYLSLFYGVGTYNDGDLGACEPAEDPANQLLFQQMFIDGWNVAPDGSSALGPKTKVQETYVTLGDAGSVSIRDARIDGGFGPHAVLACGNLEGLQ